MTLVITLIFAAPIVTGAVLAWTRRVTLKKETSPLLGLGIGESRRG
jgi:hypothetical protein